MIIRISFSCDREIRGHMDVEAITHVLKQYTGTHKSKQRENAKQPKKSIRTSKRGGELSTMKSKETSKKTKHSEIQRICRNRREKTAMRGCVTSTECMRGG